jgi:excisionase family DNA binding protein
MSLEQLINIEEASRFLGVSAFTLREWTSRRKIKHVKLGRRVLFKRSDLIDFVNQSTIAPRPKREIS